MVPDVSEDLSDLIVKVNQSISLDFFTLKIVITIFRNIGHYSTTQCHIREHLNVQQYCCENLKSTL